MQTITGLTDAQIHDLEIRIELATRLALQSVMDQIADRIAKIQVVAAGRLALVAADEQPPADSVPAGDGLPPGQPYVSPDDLASIQPLWQEQVAANILPLAAQAWIDSSGAVHAGMMQATQTAIPRVGSIAAEQYLAQARATFESIGTDLWGNARNALLDGFERGESIPQLATRLRDSAGVTARTGVLVSRTQIIEASNAGSYAVAKASGLEMQKEWMAAMDIRTRTTHMEADGQRVGLEDFFVVGDHQALYPADPGLPPSERYNCRCTLGYVMAEAQVRQAQADAIPEPPLPGQEAVPSPVDELATNLSSQVESLATELHGRVEQVAAEARQAVTELGVPPVRGPLPPSVLPARGIGAGPDGWQPGAWSPETLDAARQRIAEREYAHYVATQQQFGEAVDEAYGRQLGSDIARVELPPGARAYSNGDVTIIVRTPAAVDDQLITTAQRQLDALIDVEPVKGPLTVHLGQESGGVGSAASSRDIYITPKRLTMDVAEPTPGGRYFMPAAKEQPSLTYTLTHEYGHVVQQQRFEGGAAQRLYDDLGLKAMSDEGRILPSRTLGYYGASDPTEAYAEAFAEHFLSAGLTENPMVLRYAQEFHWADPLAERMAAQGLGVPAHGFPIPAGAGEGITPRLSLVRAHSPKGLERAWQTEIKRITGRDITVSVPADASLATWRSWAEGTLRSLEAFPETRITEIIGIDQGVAGAYATTSGTSIRFNSWWGTEAQRAPYLRAIRGDQAGWESNGVGWFTRGQTSPAGTGFHEFGHLVDGTTLSARIHPQVLQLVQERAAAEGIGADALIAREVSAYAGSDGYELVAEAFADVMTRGEAASTLSKEIFGLMRAEYDRTFAGAAEAATTRAAEALPAVSPAGALSSKTVTQLRALAGERGIIVPAGIRKPDLIKLLEEAPASEAPVARVLSEAVPASFRTESGRTIFIEGHFGLGNSVSIRDAAGRLSGSLGQTLTDVRAKRLMEDIYRATNPDARFDELAAQLKAYDRALDQRLTDLRALAHEQGISLRTPAEGYWKRDKETAALERALKAKGVAVPKAPADPLAFTTKPIKAAKAVKAAKVAAPPAAPRPLTLAQLKRAVTEKGGTVPLGLREPALRQFVAELDRGVPMLEARARAVQTILDERKAVAQTLSEMIQQVTNGGSERVLQFWARRVEGLPAELKSTRALAEALRAGDRSAIDKAVAALTREAKLKPAGVMSEVVPLDRATMDVLGATDLPSGTLVRVTRPGFSTAVETRGGAAARATVQPLTQDEAIAYRSARPARKVAKKATAPATSRFDLAPGYRGPTGAARQREREQVLADLGRSTEGRLGPQGPGREEAMQALENMGYVRGHPTGWEITDKGREYLGTAPEVHAAVSPAGALNSKTVAELRDLARTRGVVIPPGARKADIVRLLEGTEPATAAPAKAAVKAAAKKAAKAVRAAERESTAPSVNPYASPEDIAAQERAVTAHALAQEPIRLQDLSPKRGAVLKYYQQRGDIEMNGLLRRGKPGRAPGAPAALPEEVQRSIDDVDALMAASPIGEDITVYRGVSSIRSIFSGDVSEPGSLVGRSFTDKGFTSTTASRRVADQFAGSGPLGSQGVTVEIRVPKGTHAVQISNGEYAGKVKQGWGSEQEILLERGLKYRVVSDEMVPEYAIYQSGAVVPTGQLTRRVVLEVVPSAPAKAATKAVAKTATKAAKKAAPAAPKPLPEPAKMTSAKLRDELQGSGVGKGWLTLLPTKDLNAMKAELARAVERIRAGETAADVDSTLKQVQLESRAAKLRDILDRAARAKKKPVLPSWVSRTETGGVKFDSTLHDPEYGLWIPDGARGFVTEAGYRVHFEGLGLVAQKPVVRITEWPDRGPIPSSLPGVPKAGDLLRRAPASYSQREAYVRYQAELTHDWSSVVAGPYTTKTGQTFKVEVSDVRSTAKDTTVTGIVRNEHGARVGSFTREIKIGDDGKPYAYHAYLSLDESVQGSGFAEAFNANLYDWYRRSGIERVEVHADIDVGSYTWATQGYDFTDAREAARWLRSARAKIDDAIANPHLVPQLTARQLADLDRYVADMEAGRVEPHAPEIAQFGRKKGQKGSGGDFWPGNWLMLKIKNGSSWGSADPIHISMDWHGVLHLPSK